MIEVIVAPPPASLNTLSDTTSAPGATPTTPTPLASAAMVPATWVPWPTPSLKALWPAIQLLDQVVFRFRSPVVASTPESITNTVLPVPMLPLLLTSWPFQTALTPQGRVSPLAPVVLP